MEACHSPQQSNVTSYGTTILAIISLETFAGVWINAFIVCVLCIGWVKKKTLNSNEKILLLLGCSRISCLSFSWVHKSLSIIYLNYIIVHTIRQRLASFANFFNYSNLWVSACLCVFYCIKIANFRNSFFNYLKIKIDRMVPWLLLGSGLLSLAMGIVTHDLYEILQSNNLNFTCPGNYLEAIIRMDKYYFPSFFLAVFGYAASFMAVIFAAVLLLFSLWRHKCKMQTNSMKDLSVEAHIRAMKSILSFLVMYSINFVCLVLIVFYTRTNDNIVKVLTYIYLYAFPGVHSLILIFNNPKLEKALLQILSCVKYEYSRSRNADKSWSPYNLLVYHCRK
ncbi:PREDICTED: LOW QUALITY PROTEIN: taste receptor type 2 member 9-like [Ficedula albicollis]|uniref:LOW QUALITY PROTEIN: taste receptor type 2 member 9-like n=1 Tax=Ficedula albicollis TaxID=59894 RepID=UPI0007AD8A23|nr:PREDICTED: LOW QUALITY PROTEIN: taste receptor type 2 member 9-like [Ficedula albicollis]